jgi:hypothetical protein
MAAAPSMCFHVLSSPMERNSGSAKHAACPASSATYRCSRAFTRSPAGERKSPSYAKTRCTRSPSAPRRVLVKALWGAHGAYCLHRRSPALTFGSCESMNGTTIAIRFTKRPRYCVALGARHDMRAGRVPFESRHCGPDCTTGDARSVMRTYPVWNSNSARLLQANRTRQAVGTRERRRSLGRMVGVGGALDAGRVE